ncbi:MAG: sigma-70 family RNA polymerase sigma factor [Planctomycetes bacterium]|nr:sigma-70 family RNA polymerase sigma factor [Planctomycetota bacterium]
MNESITELVLAARGGDGDAEERLFERVSDRLLTYIRLRLGPRLRQEVDSLDLLQESLFVAHEQADRFEIGEGGSYMAWLFRIAEHRILKQAEHQDAAKRRAPGERRQFSAIVDRLRASMTGPVSAAAAGERRRLVLDRLDAEDDEVRQVLLARFFEGKSLDQIAAETGRSPSGLRRLLAEAAARIGAALRELGGEP